MIWRAAVAAGVLVLAGGVGVAAAQTTPAMTASTEQPTAAAPVTWSLAIHGGAGVIERARLTPEQDQAYRTALSEALAAGAAVLERGGSALDAVEAVARLMEDNPLFNAGRGAAIGADGTVTLDAAIMDGSTQKAGAVAGVMTTRHPISLARQVMETTRHVFLIGAGADQLARERGLEQVENSWFITPRRWLSLERVLTEDGLPLPPRPPGLDLPPRSSSAVTGPQLAQGDSRAADSRFGTIGVVARDSSGRLAVGTTTGGLTGKRWGRVGDAPVIGAGTWADRSCAVSATGTGEYFLRLTVARAICFEAERPGTSLQQAADTIIHRDLTGMGGDGGVIVMNAAGEAVFSLNTEGMYRGQVSSAAPARVMIYADEAPGLVGTAAAARPH
jgi:beta-aspartyl-peptidase (threonine type)